MSSYLTPYNVAIANKQRGYDVANLRNDAYQASQTPLYGGQVRGDALRQGDFQLEGGDFWSDFADGFMSVMRPVGQVAQAVAPFLGAGESGGMACRCPARGECRCGMGLSGGDEIVDAEPAVLNPDLNSTGMFHGYGLSGGYNENISGMGMSGGDFWSDLGNVASQVAPFLPLLGLGKNSSSVDKTKAVGRALVGCGFFDDLLDGISKVGQVASAVAPHIETGMKLYDKYGKGLSGGAKKNREKVGRKIFAELKALHGAGLSGGDFLGDLGNFASQIAPFAPLLLGLGLSGGQADMSYLEPFVSGFGMSGGSFVDDLLAGMDNAVKKVGDFLESGINKVNDTLEKVMPVVEKVGKVADTAGKVASIFSGKKGEGMSGGALSLEKNMDMADAMGDIFSGMGRAKNTRVLSGKQQLYKGGNIANDGIPPFNRPQNAGMSGGRDFERPVGGNSAELVALQQRSNVNQPYMTGDGVSGGKAQTKPKFIVKANDYCCLTSKKNMPCNGVPLTKAFMNDYAKRSKNYETYRQGKDYEKVERGMSKLKKPRKATKAVGTKPRMRSVGMGEAGNSESLDEIEATDALVKDLASANPAVNASPAGGKRPASKWIEHAKAYAKAHNIPYKQALKDAKATYRGAGQSGGDFWSDLGNVASSVAPFIPLLL